MAEAKKQQDMPAKKASRGKKILLIGGAVILVLLAAGAGVGLRWFQNRNEEPPTPTLPTVVEDLQNTRLDDPEAFNQELQSALDDPNLDSETRALVYIQQGNQAFDAAKYQEAAEAYRNAENLIHNSETAQLLAVTYEALGDKQQAINFYNLAIERYPTDDPMHGAQTEYFNQRIKDLSGS